MQSESLEMLFRSPIIWGILGTAFLCYGLLIGLCFSLKKDTVWFDRCRYWMPSIRIMLAALPLLGLLGTISGLLKTFFRMSLQNGFAIQEVISGGIAEAMFTTQLGLLMVVPGLLLHFYLGERCKSWQVNGIIYRAKNRRGK
ncbi:biopolymer transport protein ExbB [Alteromonadaceae bacterium 2753L.S.0a.02]|nr:biopolymer transport protein ExbB [Alteromonadaceae bacterium 2753L.S.0a.02]